MANRDNHNPNRGNNNQNNDQKRQFNKIEVPLSIYYKDKDKLYLPDGIAHEKAVRFKKIAPHQLRKILNQSKVCRDEAMVNNFEIAKNHLFSLLPLAAYNAGRDWSLKSLYYFLAEHLNTKSIQSQEDIQVFDDLFTSIVAYHKFEKSEGEK